MDNGWLLDVYPAEDEAGGVKVWVLGEDGERRCLRHALPVTFYISGPAPRLRQVWRYLRAQPEAMELAREQRRELFSEQPLAVLRVKVLQAGEQPRLFWRTAEAFPDLTYFDTDIPLALRYAARYGVFPLAHCQVESGPQGELLDLRPLDSPWELDPLPAPLRLLWLEPDTNPHHRPPQSILLRSGGAGGGKASYRLPLEAPRPLLLNLRAILNRHDPDLLLSTYGDTWLLPHLIELSKELDLPLPLNRDTEHEIVFRPEQSYFSYGQIIYHGQQVHLFGRWHIDSRNASFFNDYGLAGIFELARVTGLPVQTSARVSPGTGISAMQVITALRQEVLVPWHKQQAERPKTAMDLVRFDQGGLVYQPLTGLHRDVAELDFISMYPSIMVRFNISPETVGSERPTIETAPELEPVIDGTEPGLIPLTLAPLLQKRLAFKSRLGTLPAWDPRRKLYQACASAHKWLLVTCFGYLGYKNARFGRIEAHEAVTAYGREALLRAKEAAEDMGFTVLHMYVDGMWVHKPGASTPEALLPLQEEIARRTGLPVALEGIYRWIAFLGSRLNQNVPVANRYFGVFQDGSLKLRGIEARRHDTPQWVAAVQLEALEILGAMDTADFDRARARAVGEVIALARRRITELRQGRVPLETLLVRQRLSRTVDEYRCPSPVGRAAAQLEAVGKPQRPGMTVDFLFTLGEPGVYAWVLPDPPDPDRIDVGRYVELLLRAMVTVLEPFGAPEAEVRSRVLSGATAPELDLRPPNRARLLPGR